MGCCSSKIETYSSLPYLPTTKSSEDSQDSGLGGTALKKDQCRTMKIEDMVRAIDQFQKIETRIEEETAENGTTTEKFRMLDQQRQILFEIIVIGERPWTHERAIAVVELYEKYYIYQIRTQSD